jgi:hypothetical protein
MTNVPIGLITIFAIVLVPVYVFIITAFLGRPRAPKATIILLGFPAALLVVSILAIWLMGVLLSFIIP